MLGNLTANLKTEFISQNENSILYKETLTIGDNVYESYNVYAPNLVVPEYGE